MLGWRAARTLQEIISCNAHSKHTRTLTKESSSEALQQSTCLASLHNGNKATARTAPPAKLSRRGTCGLNIKITLCVVFAARLHCVLLCISKQPTSPPSPQHGSQGFGQGIRRCTALSELSGAQHC